MTFDNPAALIDAALEKQGVDEKWLARLLEVSPSMFVTWRVARGKYMPQYAAIVLDMLAKDTLPAEYKLAANWEALN